jgi:hypothetical protein
VNQLYDPTESNHPSREQIPARERTKTPDGQNILEEALQTSASRSLMPLPNTALSPSLFSPEKTIPLSG